VFAFTSKVKELSLDPKSCATASRASVNLDFHSSSGVKAFCMISPVALSVFCSTFSSSLTKLFPQSDAAVC
jgi:hypothetical protein